MSAAAAASTKVRKLPRALRRGLHRVSSEGLLLLQLHHREGGCLGRARALSRSGESQLRKDSAVLTWDFPVTCCSYSGLSAVPTLDL